MNQQGQIQLTFNWIYILLAGVVILLFFIGIVVKQKAASEEQLSADVLQILESIFTAAGVSEKTKIPIDTSGLSDKTLFFHCTDGVVEYGIEGSGSSIQDTTTPLFAPQNIQTNRLLLWSLPYNLPFKVVDFLFVSSPNVKYVIIGGDSAFSTELINATEGFTVEDFTHKPLTSLEPGDAYHVRLIDLTGTQLPATAVPTQLQDGLRTVSAVRLVGNTVTYYQADGASWKKIDEATIFALDGARSAAHYGALFAANAQSYNCALRIALQRASLVSSAYLAKAQNIITFHSGETDICRLKVSGLDSLLGNYIASAKACSSNFFPQGCDQTVKLALQIKQANQQLQECLALY